MTGEAVQESIAAKRGYATCDVDTSAVAAIGAPTRIVSLYYPNLELTTRMAGEGNFSRARFLKLRSNVNIIFQLNVLANKSANSRTYRLSNTASNNYSD